MSNYFINRDKIIDSNDIMIINQLLLNNYNEYLYKESLWLLWGYKIWIQ